MWLHKKTRFFPTRLTIIDKKGRLQKLLGCCFGNLLFLLEERFPERNYKFSISIWVAENKGFDLEDKFIYLLINFEHFVYPLLLGAMWKSF